MSASHGACLFRGSDVLQRIRRSRAFVPTPLRRSGPPSHLTNLLRLLIPLTLLAANISATTHVQAQNLAPTTCGSGIPHSAPSTGWLAPRENAFGFSLFNRLFEQRTQANVFISPISVALALDMAYDGARGSTQSAMAKPLRLGKASQSAVRQQAAALLASLQSSPANEGLTVASSLWARSGVPFQSRFLQRARRFYGAKVTTLNFRSAHAPATINGWVHCATQGKISTIVDRIPSDLILYLINAVYFHGSWAQPFSPSRTHNQTFTTSNGQQKQLPMMQQTGTFPYLHGSGFEAIRLPYHTARFGMVIALPNQGTSLPSIARRLSAAKWKSWTAGMKPTYGALALPRFSLSNDFQLSAPLSALGMAPVFSDHADFLGMCVNPCRLSAVRHKTYLSVDEKGTTASGATSVGVVPTAIGTPHFHMVVDRPFLVSIQDSRTGAILFFGAVNNPA